MHTQHESTEHRLSRNKILIINSNNNTQSGHSENGLTFKCDYLESLCSRCKDVCDGTKFSRRNGRGMVGLGSGGDCTGVIVLVP